jgi:hypothetical protein
MVGSPRCGRGLSSIRLLAATFVAASACTLAAAVEMKDEPKPKVTLSPEVEAKFGEFLKKVTEAKRKVWATRMEKEIEQVARVTGLTADEAKALEPAAKQATESSLEDWLSKLGESWRRYLGEQANGMPAIEEMFAQTDQAAQTDWFGEYTRPYENPQWTEGLRRTLTAEQAATWEKVQAEHKQAVLTQTGGMLKTAVDRASEQQRQALLAKAATIQSTLSLPKERMEKFESLAKKAAAATAESLRQRGERMLFAMDDAQRQLALKNRQFYLSLDAKDLETQQAAWKEGSAAILSAEEMKRLETAAENYKTRRAVVMGQVMLLQFEEKVAFTASQRERLQPIAERLVKGQPSLFPEANTERYFRLDPQIFFTAGTKATEEEMKAILDPSQWKHWQEACLTKNSRVVRTVFAGKKNAPPAGPETHDRAPDPEEVEHAFSDFLHEKTTNERKRLLAINLLKAEDAARIAGLAPEAAARLATAARGATEETLAAWKPNTESSVRSQLRDATPENIRQRLAGMDTYSYSSSRSGPATPGPTIWESTVKAEIPEEGRAAWQKELDARIAYRDRAIAAMVMAEFDRKIPLTAGQWTKLEPVIAAAVKDYAPDIGMMFSSSNPWYLQSYSMFVPFAAVPEKDLKAMLSKEQWERWNGSEEMSSTNNYWENVQRYHTQRTKEKK